MSWAAFLDPTSGPPEKREDGGQRGQAKRVETFKPIKCATRGVYGKTIITPSGPPVPLLFYYRFPMNLEDSPGPPWSPTIFYIVIPLPRLKTVVPPCSKVKDKIRIFSLRGD